MCSSLALVVVTVQGSLHNTCFSQFVFLVDDSLAQRSLCMVNSFKCPHDFLQPSKGLGGIMICVVYALVLVMVRSLLVAGLAICF